MGTFMTEIGQLHIPDEKWDDFVREAEIVAREGGLFGRSYINMKGKWITLLQFPDFAGLKGEEDCADFSYSYYENRGWENAGVNFENHDVYSNKIGNHEFNLAVQALYYLAETYSDSLYVARTDAWYGNEPDRGVYWLRYILKRDVQYTWRKDPWKIMELHAEKLKKMYDREVRLKPYDFKGIALYGGEESQSKMNAFFWDVSIREILTQLKNEESKEDVEPPKGIISIASGLRMINTAMRRFRDQSEMSEDKQIEFRLNLITGDQSEIKKIDDDIICAMIGTLVTSPQIFVMVLAEIYKKDFWTIWLDIKDKITVQCPERDPEKIKAKDADKTITTEEFYKLEPVERLLWWTPDGDVNLTGEPEAWLEKTASRFQKLQTKDGKEDILYCQETLVKVLADHEDYPMIENCFYEFLGNFNKVKYRTAVRLLEEAEDGLSFKRILALLANTKLRKKVLKF